MECGLLRTDPRPTARSIGAYYPSDYSPYSETAAEPRLVRRWLRRVVDPLDVALPRSEPGRLLELGAASGNFLLAMQNAGWDVQGVELDEAAAARASCRTRAPIVVSDVASVDFEPRSFDLVCAWMVIEHLHDPVTALARCHRWLSPGGWLAFSVPDASSWQLRAFGDAWFSLELPRHLYHFTPATVRQSLARCGYGAVSLRWQRTQLDTAMSVAYRFADRYPGRADAARALALSAPVRAASRAIGLLTAPAQLTGRITVWAQKPS